MALQKKYNHQHGTIAFLLLILSIAFAVRFWNIGLLPAGIYPDEAQNAVDGLRAGAQGAFQWFYPDNNGREGLFINMIAWIIMTYGVSVVSFKLPSIFIGTLTVLGTYLVAREVFWRHRAGTWLALIAAFLVATSFWHINFSRIAFRAIMLPFVLTMGIWLLLRGFRLLQDHRKHAIIAFCGSGAWIGLGMHTYIAARIAPAIIFAAFLIVWIFRRVSLRTLILPGIAWLGSAILVAMPMLYTYYTHPEFLTSRSASVSVFALENNNGALLNTLGTTIGKSMGQYLFVGDQNWRHNLPTQPELHPIVGFFLYCGIGLAFWTGMMTLWRRIRYPRIHHADSATVPADTLMILVAWFVCMLAPAFLTVEGIPHALRSIGTLPVAYLLATTCLAFLWERAARNMISFRMVFIPILWITLVFIGISGVYAYHVTWASAPEMAHAFNKNLTDIGIAAATVPLDTDVVVVAGPMERLPIMMFTYGKRPVHFLYPQESDSLAPPQEKPLIVFVPFTDAAFLATCMHHLKTNTLSFVTDQFGMSYAIITAHPAN